MSEDAPPYGVNVRGCAFCGVDQARIAWSSPLAIALWDVFPVSLGHALILPRRHAASWSELVVNEKVAMTAGVDAMRALIDERYGPDAYNVGFNDGEAAGQTIMHFHVHVIPRYQGDVLDPRGGIRWVLPDKAAYWLSTEP
jgi:diadenosine tetraphosphate (Ap4A) HIT family hydrolase